MSARTVAWTSVAIALLVALASLLALQAHDFATSIANPPPASALDQPARPRPVCPEYTRGRVLAGELQRLRCDVRPPQSLDLVMARWDIDDQAPKYRCRNMGGTFIEVYRTRRSTTRTPICMGVDY